MQIDYFLVALISLGILSLIMTFLIFKIIKLSNRNKELYILSKKQYQGIISSNELISLLKSQKQALEDKIKLLEKRTEI